MLLLTISFNGSSSFRSMHAGLGEVPVKSLLLLNERNGAAEYLRVVVRQVNALPTFHTDKTISTTLADLFTLLFAANPFSAARASLRRWSSDEFEDGLAHGGQCRSRRRPVDSFFPALLF